MMHVASAGNDAGTRMQYGLNTRLLTATSGGRQSNDGLTSPRATRTSNEVNLTTNAAIEILADRIGTNLTCQVHLERRVDGHHPVVACDEKRVVCVLAWVKLHFRETDITCGLI